MFILIISHYDSDKVVFHYVQFIFFEVNIITHYDFLICKKKVAQRQNVML